MKCLGYNYPWTSKTFENCIPDFILSGSALLILLLFAYRNQLFPLFCFLKHSIQPYKQTPFGNLYTWSHPLLTGHFIIIVLIEGYLSLYIITLHVECGSVSLNSCLLLLGGSSDDEEHTGQETEEHKRKRQVTYNLISELARTAVTE